MKRLIRHLSRSAPVVAMALVVGTAPSVASPVYDSGLTMTQRDEPGDLTWAQRLVIMQATLPFHDVDEAVAAGYAPTDECVDDPNLGGMGYHYVNPALIEDGIVDPTIPEALLYAPARDGEIRLVAVEYVANDDDDTPCSVSLSTAPTTAMPLASPSTTTCTPGCGRPIRQATWLNSIRESIAPTLEDKGPEAIPPPRSREARARPNRRCARASRRFGWRFR